MKKPKILILSLTYLPFIGGAEIAVQEITKRLSNDFEFDLITARLDKKLSKFEKINNVNIYRIGFGCKNLDKYIFTFFGFFKALKLHLKNKYKIIWSIMAAYSSFAVLFKIFTKAKVVLTLQEGDPIQYIINLKRFKIFRPIYKLYFKKVDKVQVISNFLKNWAIDLGINENKIVVVPNGVGQPTFAPNNSKWTTAGRHQGLKNRLNIKENEKIILSVSRLVEKNGVENLISSLKILKNKNIKLLIIGDGPLKNKLKNLVQELKLKNKIIFLGELPFEETQKYYSIADVFCRPSISEGFGNVFIEAMANQVPVVATKVGGIVDFLKDLGSDQTGWFCKVKNPQSIAEKINYILDEKNKNEVEKVVENAKKMVDEKYLWDRTARDMEKIFKILC